MPSQDTTAELKTAHSKSNLFIRNIPYDATSAELEAFFSDLGPVRSCFVVLDNRPQLPEPVLVGETAEAKKKRETPKNKGYGFVQYALPDDADRAVKELAEIKFRGERKLKIEHALKRGIQHEAGAEELERAAAIKKKQETKAKREEVVKEASVKKERLEKKDAPQKQKGHLPAVELLPYQTVVIEGLGKDLTKKHVYKKARKSGDVTELIYPVFSEAKEGEEKTAIEGVAHIIYKLPRDAQTAVKNLDGHVFKGVPLKAKALASGPTPVPHVDNFVDKNARLIIRNLPWKYREADLQALFSKHGKVIEVKLPRKFEGGPLKGFAFIQYEKALTTLNGTVHYERTIAVDWALAKDKFVEAEAKAEENEEEEAMEVDGDEGEQEDGMDVESGGEEIEDEEEEIEEADEDSEEEDVEDVDYGDEDDGSEVLLEDEVDEDDEMDEGMDVDESDSDNDNDDDATSGTYSVSSLLLVLSFTFLTRWLTFLHSTENGAKKPAKKVLPTPIEGTTLFVRNLPFEATEEELKELFENWGAVRYARITMDKDTGRSRGTGFVCFKEKSSADACLDEAEAAQRQLRTEDTEAIPHHLLSNKQKKQKTVLASTKSVLTPDPGSGLATVFALHARVLDVVRAVERDEAGKLAEINLRKREKEDKRNVYLMREGVIFPDTPAASALTPADLQKRQMLYAARKKLLATNPALFISKTRLSIRNLPLKTTDADLRKLAIEAVTKFKTSVRAGLRSDLTSEEKAEGWSFKPHVKQAKIVRAKDRVDAATQQLRSKGYGFLEFRTHAHALAALRYLNNNPDVFGDGKRLTVEFSVENKEVVERRAEMAQRSRERGTGANSVGVLGKRKCSYSMAKTMPPTKTSSTREWTEAVVAAGLGAMEDGERTGRNSAAGEEASVVGEEASVVGEEAGVAGGEASVAGGEAGVVEVIGGGVTGAVVGGVGPSVGREAGGAAGAEM
ncbi:hypothetical protein BC938DRAFT_481242 [Jimgerdemannia flammicorona]|uniref:RRM domain-containing protein n=1 Tax=Jimgerdemannia flammicorona TaxID=994334 RepID=A0A433QGJ3_9FUNG|nr:hypothetical protein BC938DRAFT_481242 [Jimgerdemannia flammicorona]